MPGGGATHLGGTSTAAAAAMSPPSYGMSPCGRGAPAASGMPPLPTQGLPACHKRLAGAAATIVHGYINGYVNEYVKRPRPVQTPPLLLPPECWATDGEVFH